MKEELRLKAINRIKETTPVLKDRSDAEIMAMCLVRVEDYVAGATETTKELQEENKELNIKIDRLESACNAYNYSQQSYQEEIKELKRQLEKLIDFVLSKTECCGVCPITDTCINEEGTCPYAGILAKCEEEVTREWLMQFISKE